MRSGGRDFETRRYCPSAVQLGETMSCGRSRVGPSFVTARGSLPSAFAIQRFSTPVRSLRKAISLPSGENTGWLSKEMPPMIRVAVPPAIGRV